MQPKSGPMAIHVEHRESVARTVQSHNPIRCLPDLVRRSLHGRGRRRSSIRSIQHTASGLLLKFLVGICQAPGYPPAVSKKLFLLDGMALVYRAHFALVSRPIFTSKGVNTSALFVFTNTLLDVLQNQRPSHIAVAFDTDAATDRHRAFPDYKIQREAMPEDIAWALPHVRRLLDAFHVTGLTCDGYEADDIIGTLVRRAEPQGFECYMVTPDKDFGQLVSEKTFICKPARMGDASELLALPAVREKWRIERPDQVIDIIGLWGDASDNIPGVPGIGEKTASKLI